ncbi:MAG: ATP-binding protein [Spirochaetaceae bacterium]|jgi:magnesium chelatase subunit I|nr:ATP-binding protein [Spirochaetaceae bacterium]
MDSSERGYCFTAIVGQEDMKTALVLNAVNPNLGGVLIRGEKGTAKSTAVRALAELLPPREQVAHCRFGCDPHDEERLCAECVERRDQGEALEGVFLPMRVIDLPVSATEDRVVGTLDMEHAIKTGEKRFETGILARANRNILYVDEVNLLDDHVVDLLLDSAAMGVNTVEREGVSYTHAARFILVGTMNPEEGDLRPQLLDRFGLSVTVTGEGDTAARVAVMENRLKFENDPDAFFAEYEPKQEELRRRILEAQRLLGKVAYSRSILERIAAICIKLDVDGHRADIGMLKTAMTLAAFNGRQAVSEADLRQAARLVLPHRMRRRPFEDTGLTLEDLEKL